MPYTNMLLKFTEYYDRLYIVLNKYIHYMQIEPGTSPKHRYELIKATLLVIVGALITITIVYGVPYFSPKEVADPIETVATNPEVKPTPVVENTSAPVPTPTPTPEAPKEKVYTQDELNTIFEMDKKKPSTKIFYSDKLGVGFTYNLLEGFSPDTYEVPVSEQGNGVVIGYQEKKGTPASGRKSLQVFNKDSKDTLEQAITKEFLQGVDSKKCFAQKYEHEYLSKENPQYKYAEIFYTPTQGEEVGFNNGIENCPEKIHRYVRTNASLYFFEDTRVPSKYVFVILGQESIAYSGIGSEDWSGSIRILK